MAAPEVVSDPAGEAWVKHAKKPIAIAVVLVALAGLGGIISAGIGTLDAATSWLNTAKVNLVMGNPMQPLAAAYSWNEDGSLAVSYAQQTFSPELEIIRVWVIVKSVEKETGHVMFGTAAWPVGLDLGAEITAFTIPPTAIKSFEAGTSYQPIVIYEVTSGGQTQTVSTYLLPTPYDLARP